MFGASSGASYAGWRFRAHIRPGRDGEPDQRQHLVQRRRRHPDQPPHLRDCRHQRIQLKGPALLEILQHRGAVAPHVHGHVDALLDVHGEGHAERRGNGDGLGHHPADDSPGVRMPAHLLEGRTGEDADRVERGIAQELEPDVVADLLPHGGLEPCGGQHLAQSPDPRRFRAVRLTDHEARALDVPDHAGLDDLAGRVDDAADGALRPEGLPDASAGVGGVQVPVAKRAGERVEIPPEDAVLCRDDGRLRPKERLQLVEYVRRGMGLERQDDVVLGTQGHGIVGAAYRHCPGPGVAEHGQATTAHGSQVWPAGHQ